VLKSEMMTDFAVEIVAAVMVALFAETNAFKEKVGEEELSLFMVVTTAEASIKGG
jgi:predicted regulator of Ras-like GTPase activity (Roadblock/LC7/MglB family)